jgi:hypothetical protein
MSVRTLSVVGSLVVALGLVVGTSNSAAAAPLPRVFPGQPLSCPGEANLVVAINAINRALQFPQLGDVQINAAVYQIEMALRIQDCLHVQRDLNKALQMLNAYRYRRDPAALQIALERTECALNELREDCLAKQQVYRPGYPQPQPPVVYPVAYPVPVQNRSLTIAKGAFSITIPLGR